jgi:hypothetical protein
MVAAVLQMHCADCTYHSVCQSCLEHGTPQHTGVSHLEVDLVCCPKVVAMLLLLHASRCCHLNGLVVMSSAVPGCSSLGCMCMCC